LSEEQKGAIGSGESRGSRGSWGSEGAGPEEQRKRHEIEALIGAACCIGTRKCAIRKSNCMAALNNGPHTPAFSAAKEEGISRATRSSAQVHSHPGTPPPVFKSSWAPFSISFNKGFQVWEPLPPLLQGTTPQITTSIIIFLKSLPILRLLINTLNDVKTIGYIILHI